MHRDLVTFPKFDLQESQDDLHERGAAAPQGVNSWGADSAVPDSGPLAAYSESLGEAGRDAGTFPITH